MVVIVSAPQGCNTLGDYSLIGQDQHIYHDQQLHCPSPSHWHCQYQDVDLPKLSSNSFMLTALLPVPKFIHEKKHMCGVLEDRLIHQCLDIVLEPIKKAVCLGVMMSDPNGHNCYCFTPLSGYIADTPEAAMFATVGGKTSPVTMAMYKQFGDPFQHKPRTASTTLAQLSIVKSKADPQDIQAFFREAQKFHLNGVYEPFWRDMLFSCPGYFLTPEVLHYFHKQCWDHNVKWCIHVVGASEFDF